MRRAILLLFAVILGGPAPAQVTTEMIANGPDENWLSYSGDYSGRRHSPLDQINTSNAANLVPKWNYHLTTGRRLSAVPVVYEGIMYVGQSNSVRTLDARSGRELWSYTHPGVDSERPNRGVALGQDKVLFVTGDCQVVAVQYKTGAALWAHQYADPKQGYHCTMAPLVVKDQVIVGVSGGDSGMRGFLSVHSLKDGAEIWRLWTIPAPGEPGSETWGPKTLPFGGAGTWMPGTYDPETNVLYWGTGNPWPDFYGGDRPGDNLYTDSLLAIDFATGKMLWYHQFTPHDVWDWDAQEFPVILDTEFEGKPRKLVVQANRNGFYYVFDRTTGEYLLGTPFADKLNWAKGLDEKGHPILVEGRGPQPNGVEACPTVRGATNFMSPSYNPDTGLLYFPVLEACDIYTSSARDPKPFVGFAGTGGQQPSDEKPQFFLRALDPATGERVWEYPMTGPGVMWAGTVSTAGGLVFFGDDDHHLVAVNAKTGEHLWHYNLGQQIFSSPITYMVDGKQYVTIASQNDVFTFGLFEPAKPIPTLKISPTE